MSIPILTVRYMLKLPIQGKKGGIDVIKVDNVTLNNSYTDYCRVQCI